MNRTVVRPLAAAGGEPSALRTPAAGVPTPRLKIAFIARRFGARFGGAEAYGERVFAELAQRHDIHVFCQEWDSPLAVPHTVLPRRRGLPRWVNLIAFGLQCAHRVRGFDVVHSHENLWVGDVQVVHVMPVRYSRFHTGRGWIRGILDRLSPRWLAYLALESLRVHDRPGHAVVSASSLIAQQVAAAYPRISPSVVIPPAVTLPPASPDRGQARVELGLEAGRVYAVLIANDPIRKGLQAVLEALAQLPERVHVLVAGGDEATAARVRTLASAAGQGARVHVWPGRRDVEIFYRAADLCLFPTRGDAFGMVPLEAMAHRLPVVMSGPRHCGFAAHVTAGHHALLLDDPTDAGRLARAVQRLLDDAPLRAQLSREGYRLAGQFTWPATARRFESLYLSLARSPDAPPALPGAPAV
ncbi:glycosyltransferase family 4 protein [Achromobacter sp. GG226]|uniref:glycosyltransferase family 4 protein n=1 Tax=Verticiella alkaliphila TaxID=2779529 RepID=UPI001C0D84EE|nr:glycosyltransferase family 4 protein [Verticiella sp. GG226]MBU4611857.1 glycosyltransferase family 4 protein [Verticiella sp. GG226]